jgi:ATP-binding cassette subfamily C (CFTR/MRP) protein 1
MYFKLNGGWPFICGLFVVMCIWSTLSILASIQIQKWCESPREDKRDLWIYAGFAISTTIFGFIRVLTLAISGVRQGAASHKKMIKGLIYASITGFYDRIPTGRILSRVSKDLRQLD